MKLKVCGLNNPQNIEDIVKLEPDYIGFIFYPESKRFVSNYILPEFLSQIPTKIKKIGVFVNEQISELKKVYNEYKLDYAQLHGEEDSSYCAKLYLENIPVIKAFSLDESFDFKSLNAYEPFCSYFLFDTKGLLPGGNGIKFNWDILHSYELRIPFFLSGGIGENETKEIQELSFEMLDGIDVNSKFEITPGLKDVQKLKRFINDIKMVYNENTSR